MKISLQAQTATAIRPDPDAYEWRDIFSLSCDSGVTSHVNFDSSNVRGDN